MKNIIIAVASALLLAVAITELSVRIWPGNELVLLALSFVALLINGLLNARQAGGSRAPVAATTPRRDRQRSRDGRGGKDTNRKRRGERPAEKSDAGQRTDRSRDKDRSNNGGDRNDNHAGSSSSAAAGTAVAADGPREEGTVKWFNRSKGFGFVVRPNGEEIFVHQRSIRSSDGQGRPVLKDGETVSFVVAERERGLQAEDVVPSRAG